MALTTTTGFFFRLLRTISATRRIAEASSTDVPPNFIITMKTPSPNHRIEYSQQTKNPLAILFFGGGLVSYSRILYFAQLFPRQEGLIRVPEPVWGRINELIFWLV